MRTFKNHYVYMEKLDSDHTYPGKVSEKTWDLRFTIQPDPQHRDIWHNLKKKKKEEWQKTANPGEEG